MSVPSVGPRGRGGRSLKSLPTVPPGARRNTSERLFMASTCASRRQYSIQGEEKSRIKKAQRDEGGSPASQQRGSRARAELAIGQGVWESRRQGDPVESEVVSGCQYLRVQNIEHTRTHTRLTHPVTR